MKFSQIASQLCNNIYMEVFAKRLRELRKEKGVTLLQIEKEIGFSKSAVNDWENGGSVPSALALIALARFFEVTTDYLLGMSDF